MQCECKLVIIDIAFLVTGEPRIRTYVLSTTRSLARSLLPLTPDSFTLHS
eukprot:COSAG06_NODE_2406_length_6930_cov_2.986532_5_plen_50_part_00